MADLAKLRALHEAATPGEWKCHDGRDDYEHRVAVELSAFAEDPVCDVITTPDAALIAAMHEALPELLAIAEAVERDAKASAADAYKAGWINAAKWANRTDLISDIGSGAYERDRDAAIDRLPTDRSAG